MQYKVVDSLDAKLGWSEKLMGVHLISHARSQVPFPQYDNAVVGTHE